MSLRACQATTGAVHLATAPTPPASALIVLVMPMEAPTSAPAPAEAVPAHGNLILKAIPPSEYQILQPHLERVSLEWHHALHLAGERITYGYFPGGGVVSLVVPMTDGRSAEVGMVGREGFVGAPLAGGLNHGPHVALVQVAAQAMRVAADSLRELLPATPRLATLLTRYALVQGMQLAQTAACNRLHNLEQRLARWLLMSQDRVNTNALPYTQDLLAIMLGTDRPSVSVAVGELQAKGSIKQRRGSVEFVDRRRLEKSACECYRIIQEYDVELKADTAR